MPRSHNLVLHRTANPGPLWASGFKSQSRRFLLSDKMEKDLIDYMVENPTKIPEEVGRLHEHSLEELCRLKRELNRFIGVCPDNLQSMPEEIESYVENEHELLNEVKEMVQINLYNMYN